MTTGRSTPARITDRALRLRRTGPITSAWYTNGKARKGLFYAHSRDEGRTFSAPMALGQPGRNPTRPYVLAGAVGTVMVWKEFDGEKTSVQMMISRDVARAGRRRRRYPSTPTHPIIRLLVSNGQQVLFVMDDESGWLSAHRDRGPAMRRRFAAFWVWRLLIASTATLGAAPSPETVRARHLARLPEGSCGPPDASCISGA